MYTLLEIQDLEKQVSKGIIVKVLIDEDRGGGSSSAQIILND